MSTNTVVSPGVTVKQKTKKDHTLLKSVLFLLPAWILLLIFFVGPILLTFYFAFTNLSLTGTQAKSVEFIGFQNFLTMFQDPNFRISVVKTMVFLLLSAVIGQQVLGFILAVLMKEKNKTFRRIIGIIVLAGWVTPEIVVAFCWVAFLSDNGTLNMILQQIGLKPVTWMYTFPMVSVVIANIWHGTAFSMLVFQAALDDVPKSVEEAAVIDGANRFQVLFRIVLPMVKGSIVTNMILVTLQTLGVFTLIFAMTGGGPGTSTQTLPIFMYNQAFVNYQLGYGTAISLILLVIGIGASLIYMRSMKVEI
ncbi:multiple sugar transport system permease protein [Peribacillus deserti]|uniref:Multiple sugar transport system permease protein n=1 Tax=Peribacillus deserti TaxID=673318 RepID=A0ABS2QF65_9BACI|nr:sugar ABC transporter permease [Peribacillus deserti]MBM7691615.1 multiple sugar transport system permease protein [Peribacillus deserti]